jgi:hypothetical protein
MKARCCGGEVLADGTWVVHLEVPPGTHIQIDEEWTAERGADQPSDFLTQWANTPERQALLDAERKRLTDQQSGCPACGNGCYSPERGCADGKCRMYKAPDKPSA